MDDRPSQLSQIVQTLSEKGPVKADVIQNTEAAFTLLKSVLKGLESDLVAAVSKKDSRIPIRAGERGVRDLELKISDDILIFTMHTDIYSLPETHAAWKHSYVRDKPSNAFMGLISIYNFLTDSLKYQRMNDVGILLGRLFINRENHYFVEGKKQLGFLFSDFETNHLDAKALRTVVEAAVIQALDVELSTPPFEQMKQISVQEVLEKSVAYVVSTGKRLGFKFQSDSDPIQ